jgi:hypothetical protein
LEHRQKTIARTRNTRIDQCTCGAIHISVGSTTVRISEGAARELKDSLARAIEQVDATAASQGTTTAAGGYRVTLPGDDDESGGPKVH